MPAPVSRVVQPASASLRYNYAVSRPVSSGGFTPPPTGHPPQRAPSSAPASVCAAVSVARPDTRQAALPSAPSPVRVSSGPHLYISRGAETGGPRGGRLGPLPLAGHRSGPGPAESYARGPAGRAGV